MRDYSKVYPQIWIGHTGRELKKHGVYVQLLAHYLVSSPHAHMIGIYYLPISFIVHETGMDFDTTSKALKILIDLDFCTYDEDKEYVWVHNMAFFQIAEQLKPNDNVVKNVNSYFKKLPQLKFLSDFFKKYNDAYCLKTREGVTNTFEDSLKPLRSKEKEKDKDKEKEKEEEKDNIAESQNDSAYSQVETPSNLITEMISIPLENGTEFQVTDVLIEKWQKTFPDINVVQILRNIQDWNTANPKKRKKESGILRHINLWFVREQEKNNTKPSINLKQSNTLFDLNQSIANAWLDRDANGDVH